MRIKLTIDTNLVGCQHKKVVTLDSEETEYFQGLTQNQKDEYLREMEEDYLGEKISVVAEVLEDA